MTAHAVRRCHYHRPPLLLLLLLLRQLWRLGLLLSQHDEDRNLNRDHNRRCRHIRHHLLI